MSDKNILPLFSIVAGTDKSILIPNFFDAEEGGVKSLLQEPNNIRRFGWNMSTLDTARMQPGDYWQLKNGNVKTIRLYKEGTLSTRAYANEDFWGWGTNKKDEDQYLNALALIEFVLEFVRLYKDLIKSSEGDYDGIIYKFGFSDTGDGDARLQVHQGNIAKVRNYIITGDFHEGYFGGVIKKEFNPGEHAFEIMKIIFYQFELEESNIKFVSVNSSGKKEISEELISQVN